MFSNRSIEKMKNMEGFSITDEQSQKNLKRKAILFLRNPLVPHLVFWLGYFMFNTLRWGSYFDDYWYSFRSNLVEFPIHVILVYFNLYFLLPRYIPSRLPKYLVLLFLSILIMSLVRIVLTYQLVTTEVWRESVVKDQALFGFNYIVAVFMGELYVVGLTTAIKLIIDWVRTQRKARELERRNHETELSFLRSQVQPHFFFNTLNNLYSLTLDKSDKAPETVLKLSDLMSYVIYKGKNNRVSLPEEVTHIQNYIDLERLRYGDNLIAEIKISGNIQGKLIPPLILMPFVENSFKHGTDYKNGKAPINIQLTTNGNVLYFTVRNARNKNSVVNNDSKKSYSGIGIQNTLRRLELLYDKNYNLDITEDESSYKVSLKIVLDED
ncbi:putative two-component system sensor protein [Fulvivirga imtechensis AK7]|uniref:Putative two-component system sensor protein n=1 Tax=Fulvivirga imtechensis AK7 TaxID=1237149 RepID=L8JJB3_9BACT|nr:histidine kinase [Fulvivirga imtechensis]ELR68318.1 putative two-component system sensor protein [Fulvivirga imtechensis AK7]